MEFLKRFERVVIVAPIGMMMIVVGLATFDLGWLIVKDIISPPIGLLEIHEPLEIFGFFLLVLIGIELLETIKACLVENLRGWSTSERWRSSRSRDRAELMPRRHSR